MPSFIQNVNELAAKLSIIDNADIIIDALPVITDNLDSLVTVADNMADVNTVASKSVELTNVVGALPSIESVISNIENVNVVATNMPNVMVVGTNIDSVKTVADNIGSLSNAIKGEYLVRDLPVVANIGDLGVDVNSGTVYEYKESGWVVIAENSADSVNEIDTTAIVTIVDTLPMTGQTGEMFFNMADGFYYAYINGEMKQFNTPVPEYAGIGVVATTVGLIGAVGDIVYDSTTKKLMEYNGSSWIEVVQPIGAVAEIGDGTITEIKLAAGITVIKNVSVLPTVDMSVGDVVYLTIDGKLYRYTASGWTASVPTQDLTGTITSIQITDGAISTPKLAAGAVTATTISANAITSDKIASNAIIAGKISAGVIGATEIASNAITSTKIAAGSISADKMLANSIAAINIQSGAITSDKLTANSVYAGAIQAGAITSTKLAADSVQATHILAGSITAAKIQAYSIDATKLSVDALIGKRIQFDSTSAASTYSVSDSVFGIQTTAYSFINTNKVYGICSVKTNSGNGSALYGLCSNTGQTGAAVVGLQQSSQTMSWAGYFYHQYWTAITATTDNASGQWGLWTGDKVWASGGYSPFTGSHIVYSKVSNLKIGQVVSSEDAWVVDIDNSLIHVVLSNRLDKRVIGVISNISNDILHNLEVMKQLNNFEKNEEGAKVRTSFKNEFQPYIDFMKNNGYKEIEINSVGEGSILVSNINGNIDNGDYLTSDGTGYTMKQDDDLLHSYTVAKALESVDWSKESSVTKMIACTYHCG